MSKEIQSVTYIKREVNWPKILFFLHVTTLATFGLVLLFQASLLTVLFSALLVLLSVLGVTAGAHRLWAHRSYTANTGLRVFLMLCHTLAGQGSIYDWVKKHRAHHAHMGTSKDPYYFERGFFRTHILANFEKECAEDEKVLKEVNMQDLENDAVVAFQRKFYWLLMPIICILLPVNAPMEYWGDSFVNSACIAGFLRYAITTHLEHLIYSAHYIWGLKPGDKYPSDTMLVFILTKSHWLRYHYILPWDYQVGEYGGYGGGYITAMIRVFAALNWATGLQTVDSNTIKDAVYAATISGKSIGECVEEITSTTHKMSPVEDHFQSAKFL